MSVVPVPIIEINFDQAREIVNTAQRFEAWRHARERLAGYRGSLVWREAKGVDYLARSYYDAAGIRRQKIEGRRDARTDRLKTQWDEDREAARRDEAVLQAALDRQAAVNRALRLGRVPSLGARIIRALDEARLLGQGLRIVGTNALYAYEAAAGVMVDPGVTTTLDIDLLLDSRRSLRVTTDHDFPQGSLIDLLRKVDGSFRRTGQTFRAVNRDGYLVDLIKPERDPPWRTDRETIGPASDELKAVSIAGLAWHESAPAFEAVAIDERGAPVRIVATDPRVFVAHKLWLSKEPSRDPLKRRRDEAQARVVAALTARYLPHLSFEPDALRMLPREVVTAALPLFATGAES